MLSFLKKIFGSKPAKESPAPYKVEKPVASMPLSTPYDQPGAEKKKPAKEKKPAVKAKSNKAPAKKSKQ